MVSNSFRNYKLKRSKSVISMGICGQFTFKSISIDFHIFMILTFTVSSAFVFFIWQYTSNQR